MAAAFADAPLGAGTAGEAPGSVTISVATYHHQAVDRLAEGLAATAWTDDATIEAAELAGPAWVVGVQWHPEVADGAPLFGAFVEQCRVREPAR